MSRHEELIDLSQTRSRTAGRRAAPLRSAPRGPDPARGQGGDFHFVRKQVARRERIRRNRLILLGCVLLLVVLAFALDMVLTLGGAVNTFYEGVTVDGLNLKGYDRQEAIEKLGVFNKERMQDVALRFRYDGQEYVIPPERIGAIFDVETQVDAAFAQGREGNIFERQSQIKKLRKEGYEGRTELIYNPDALAEAVAEVKAQIDLPAQDAKVEFDPTREEKFTIQPEVQGREVILDGLVDLATDMLADGRGGLIDVTPIPVEPRVFTKDIEGVTERIRRVTTELGNSTSARIHNIKLALEKFNGMIVQPGQEVSFNDVTGPRGLEEGYQNAGVILDDEIVDGPGGGVCQVSTTFYQALVRAGVTIVERSKHSLPVSYVPLGTDAAVAYDYKDLVFRNDYDTPIFLQCEVSGSNVSVTIYGKPLEEGIDIKIVADVLETIPAPEPDIIPDTDATYVQYTDEEHEKKKSRDGYRVRSYAVWYRDGVEFERKQLTEDYYVEVKGATYVGITPRGADVPSVPIIGGDGTDGNTED